LAERSKPVAFGAIPLLTGQGNPVLPSGQPVARRRNPCALPCQRHPHRVARRPFDAFSVFAKSEGFLPHRALLDKPIRAKRF